MRKLLIPVLLFCLWACQSESRTAPWPDTVKLITPNQETIETKLAVTDADQQKGLSGVQPEDFEDNQGMFFFYLEDDEKNFWMPDTYFDLDIIYMDKDLNVVDIVRRLPHYKGRANQDLIPRARPVWSRYALEMKAGSKISNGLKKGDQLKWKSELPLIEIDKRIRANQK